MDIVITLTIKRNGTFDLAQLSHEQRQHIRDLKRTVMTGRNAEQQKQLRKAVDTANGRPVHDPEEPLLALSGTSDDQLTWRVIDEFGTPQVGFTVQVQPFSADPILLPVPPGVPAAFAALGTAAVHESGGEVKSEKLNPDARNQATNQNWWWHKYTLTLVSGVQLDPCIFVQG